jgi:hypothetical protein
MLISRQDRGVVVDHSLTVAGDVVVFSDSMKNLGLYIDNRLSWREQVSCVVSRTYSDGLVEAPSYLSSLLVLGRSSRHRLITVLRVGPSTSLHGDSTV